MKKMLFWLCILLLVPALAMAGSDGVFIGELKEQLDAIAPNELHQSLYIPHVDTLPILKVRLKNVEKTGQGELPGYPSIVQMDYEKYSLTGNNESGTYPEKTYENLFLPNNAIHLNQIFASNQPDSADSIIQQGASMIESQVLPQSVTLQSPWKASQFGELGKDTFCDSLAGVGGYYIAYLPMLHGIPVISSIGAAFEESAIKSGNLRRVMRERSQYIYGYYSSDFWLLSGLGIWEETHIIAQDMQLCPWKKVEQTIQENIKNGTIETFHYAILGYVVYMDKATDYLSENDVQYMEYTAVPTWCISVKYKEKWSENSWMMIDAQTGDAYDYKSKRLSDWYAPDIVF